MGLVLHNHHRNLYYGSRKCPSQASIILPPISAKQSSQKANHRRACEGKELPQHVHELQKLTHRKHTTQEHASNAYRVVTEAVMNPLLGASGVSAQNWHPAVEFMVIVKVAMNQEVTTTTW